MTECMPKNGVEARGEGMPDVAERPARPGANVDSDTGFRAPGGPERSPNLADGEIASRPEVHVHGPNVGSALGVGIGAGAGSATLDAVRVVDGFIGPVARRNESASLQQGDFLRGLKGAKYGEVRGAMGAVGDGDVVSSSNGGGRRSGPSSDGESDKRSRSMERLPLQAHATTERSTKPQGTERLGLSALEPRDLTTGR